VSVPGAIDHLIHTNVAGRNQVGFRTFPIPAGWVGTHQERLLQWLAELGRRRISPEVAGWAAASFRVDARLFAAVAVVPSGWEHDGYGRKGAVLVHAAFTPVKEGTEANVSSVSLVERLSGFTTGPQEGLDAYLRECESALWRDGVAPEPVELLRDPGREDLAGFLRAAAHGPIARAAVPDAAAAAAALARSSAALPPRLRLAQRWSVGLMSADPGGTAPPFLPAAAPGAADRYREWLESCLATGRVDELVRVLHDWDIRSWTHLLQRIDPDWYG
jgi:hypothetical protein